MTLQNGNIRLSYGPTGELYSLPIYVINPPTKYGNTKEIVEQPIDVPTATLNVTAFSIFGTQKKSIR